ncbi:hypothetical protein AKO1_005286 [Acrasis kona]|uniref:Uncharacterized protein n=1 Tax=Acrasis kona TaxID=1008807 RepID=A0AAW2YLM1_9EUKA
MPKGTLKKLWTHSMSSTDSLCLDDSTASPGACNNLTPIMIVKSPYKFESKVMNSPRATIADNPSIRKLNTFKLHSTSPFCQSSPSFGGDVDKFDEKSPIVPTGERYSSKPSRAIKIWPKIKSILQIIYSYELLLNVLVNLLVLGCFAGALSAGIIKHQISNAHLISFGICVPILLSIVAAFLPRKYILYTELSFYGCLYIAFVHSGDSFNNLMERAYGAYPTIIFSLCFIYYSTAKFTIKDRTTENTTHLQRILFNIFAYVLPFCVGLQFRFYSLVLPDASLVPSEAKMWSSRVWITFSVLCVMLLSYMIYFLVLVFKSGRWKKYLVGYFFVLLFTVLFSIPSMLRDSRIEIHVHHYILTALLLPLTAFGNPVSSSLQAWLLAIHIDGVVRWSMDPTWVPVKYIWG